MLDPARPHADLPLVTAPEGCETGRDGLECGEWAGRWSNSHGVMVVGHPCGSAADAWG